MVEKIIEAVMEKKIASDYPGIKQPNSLFAVVTKGTDKVGHYRYNLKILDADLQVDDNYPEIPDVKSYGIYEENDIVVVTILYNQIIFIVGKVVV